MSNIVTGLVQRKKVGSPTRKSVLMFMASCASDDGTGIWTSKGNMAADLEMGRRTVQNCIDDLIASGLISKVGTRKCKNGFTVEYRVNLSAISKLEGTRAGRAPVQDVHMTCAGRAHQDVQDVHTNHTGTVLEPSLPPIVPHSDFETFWRLCPKKSGKGGAEKAYAKALKITDHNTLCKAMTQYAHEREGKDHKYTKTPGPWLNDKRWLDEPTETPASFHDKIDELLKGETNGLSQPNALDNRQPQQLSAPIQNAGIGRGEPDAPTESDSGSYESPYSGVIRPKRFGGAR